MPSSHFEMHLLVVVSNTYSTLKLVGIYVEKILTIDLCISMVTGMEFLSGAAEIQYVFDFS